MNLPIRYQYTFRWETYMMLQGLDDQTQLIVYKAINQYVFYGVRPEGLTDFQQRMFECIRPRVRAVYTNTDEASRFKG